MRASELTRRLAERGIRAESDERNASRSKPRSQTLRPLQPFLVNGHLGFVSRRPDGRLFAVLGFTIAGGKVVEIDILADPERLSRLDLSAIDG